MANKVRLGTHNTSHIACFHLITQNYSTVTHVTYATFQHCLLHRGLSLSKVSNMASNLHGLPTSFQAQISKHVGLILKPKSTFKSSDKKEWIILNKVFNRHNRRSHQTTYALLVKSCIGTWWANKTCSNFTGDWICPLQLTTCFI